MAARAAIVGSGQGWRLRERGNLRHGDRGACSALADEMKDEACARAARLARPQDGGAKRTAGCFMSCHIAVGNAKAGLGAARGRPRPSARRISGRCRACGR